jgi:hypothetical protein
MAETAAWPIRWPLLSMNPFARVRTDCSVTIILSQKPTGLFREIRAPLRLGVVRFGSQPAHRATNKHCARGFFLLFAFFKGRGPRRDSLRRTLRMPVSSSNTKVLKRRGHSKEPSIVDNGIVQKSSIIAYEGEPRRQLIDNMNLPASSLGAPAKTILF